MKIHKKILSLLMALTIIISSVVPVFALSDDIITGAVSAYNPLWGGFIQSSMNNIYDYMQSQQFTQQWVSGNGAEATFLTGTTLTTPKNYFATQGQGASFQNGSRREKEYAGGTSSSKTQYRPIISSTYNTTNNNYNYT